MDNNSYEMDNNSYESAPVKTVSPTNVLVFGILSLALGNIPYVGVIVAFIFALITRSKVKKYLAENNGETCGMVKTGSILSNISLVFTTIALVCYAVIIVVYIVYFAAYGIALTTMFDEQFSFMLPLMW